MNDFTERLGAAIEELSEFEWDEIGVLKNIITTDNPACECNASCCKTCCAENVYAKANKYLPTLREAATLYHKLAPMLDAWKESKTYNAPVIVHVLKYDSEKHQLECRFPNGMVYSVDPFVGCAIECTDDDYVEKGEACVGKDFIMADSWRHGVFLCHSFTELSAAPSTHDEAREGK